MARPRTKTLRPQSLEGSTFLPTLDQWRGTAADWRDRVSAYLRSRGQSRRAFCRVHEVDQAQFSRILDGKEGLSWKFAQILQSVFPNDYQRSIHAWTASFVTGDPVEFATLFDRRVMQGPGHALVVACRPLETDANPLLDLVVRFLLRPENRLTLIAVDPPPDWPSGWRYVAQASQERYVNKLVEAMAATAQPAQALKGLPDRLRSLVVTYAALPPPDAVQKLRKVVQTAPRRESPAAVRIPERLADILRWPLCLPLCIWMVYTADRGGSHPSGSVFLRSGDRYVWLSLSGEDAEAVLAYATAITSVDDVVAGLQQSANADPVVHEWRRFVSRDDLLARSPLLIRLTQQ